MTTYKVVSTFGKLEMLEPYIAQVFQSFRKLMNRFPEDITVTHLFGRVMSGENELWLILDEDEDDKYVAFVTIQKDISVRGEKRISLLELAGEGGLELVEYLHVLEDYAKSIGAKKFNIFGRKGWERGLKPLGYNIAFIKYEKRI